MAIIHNASTVTYNGVTLPAILSTTLSAKPVLDDANRMTKWIEYTFNAKFYVADIGGAKVDAIIKGYRNKLTANGKALDISNKGFGQPFTINKAPGPWDVNWGPKVTKFFPKMFGNGQVAMVEWEVTFCIPECTGSATQRILSMACYTVTYDIDREGLTVITTAGAIEIPLTFWQGQTLGDNADAYWENVNFPVPLGYVRETNHRSLSNDRRRLEFNLVDRQLHTAYPPFCTEVHLEQEIYNLTSQGSHGSIVGIPWRWRTTFSGTIKTSGSKNKSLSLAVFLQFVASRLTIAILEARANNGAMTMFPGQLRIREKAMAYETSFSYTIDLTNSRGYATIINESGLFRPVGWDHAVWQKSILDVQDPRGLALVEYTNRDDTLLDLCTKNVQPPVVEPGDAAKPPANYPPAPPLQTYPPPVSQVLSQSNNVVSNPVNDLFALYLYFYSFVPPPETSWLSYDVRIEYEQDHKMVEHLPLDGAVSPTRPPFTPTVLGAIQGYTSGAQPITGGAIQATSGGSTPPGAKDISGVTTTVKSRVQRLTMPSVRVRVVGSAMRLGYPIIPPRLITFDGQDVTQNIKHTWVTYGSQQNSSGVAVYYCAWSIEYIVTQPAQNSLPVLANPEKNINGSGN